MIDGNVFGKALAWGALGDLRDWPAECPKSLGGCGSRNLDPQIGLDRYRCRDCGQISTGYVVWYDRAQRAEKETGIS